MGFFDLTRPEHAYLFGFLQCDGHLTENTRNRGRLSVELSIRDVALLERFQELVPYPTSITTRTRTTNFAKRCTSAVWTLHAWEARRELIRLGLPVGRKSGIVRPPSAAFSKADYLRGLVDADGSVGFMTDGTVPFVSLTTASGALKDFFIESCPRLIGAPRGRLRNARDGVYNLLVIREAAVAVARRLYYDGVSRNSEEARHGATRAELGQAPGHARRHTTPALVNGGGRRGTPQHHCGSGPNAWANAQKRERA